MLSTNICTHFSFQLQEISLVMCQKDDNINGKAKQNIEKVISNVKNMDCRMSLFSIPSSKAILTLQL